MKNTEIPKPVMVDNRESVKYHIVGWESYLNHKPIYAIDKIYTPIIREEKQNESKNEI